MIRTSGDLAHSQSAGLANDLVTQCMVAWQKPTTQQVVSPGGFAMSLSGLRV
jgi:hypothetical protein